MGFHCSYMFRASHKQWEVAILILINTSASIKFRIVEMDNWLISTSAPAGTRSVTLSLPRQNPWTAGLHNLYFSLGLTKTCHLTSRITVLNHDWTDHNTKPISHWAWQQYRDLVTIALGEWSKTCSYSEGRVTMAAPSPCRYVWQHIQRHMYDNTRFNLVKSVNRYQLHMTVRRTTIAYNGTIATKGLFTMCPSANIIFGIKDKLILRANDLGIYCRI